ncbi:hypothetical protein KKG22_00875 [Patescibacteria group bacterium]|nr:hypothetical protein [Patescibacteria group bacterium]MBU1721988.1 hypothetical protein [Patescibacteria group bacterium]MBU1901263.1 hypothetical protein [Patescibacteria group bacterium]
MNKKINFESIGEVDLSGDCTSKPISVPFLKDKLVIFNLEYLFEESDVIDFDNAIKVFLKNKYDIFDSIIEPLYEYYQDNLEYSNIDIEKENILNHIQFGNVINVEKREYDKKVYLSFECECDWEREHGLQIVFKEGNIINKIGPYDGYLTNASAYGNKEFDDIIYVKSSDIK